MAKGRNIKGITIEIGGDTTKLDKALTKADKAAKGTADQLKDVERLLKLDPTNVELLAQKQDLLSQRVEQTGDRYKMLQDTVEGVTASNVKWTQWEEAQASIQGQITRTRNELLDLEAEAKNLADLGFDADSTDMVAIQDQIDGTIDRLNGLDKKLKDTYEELGRPVSVDQYKALQRELVESKDAYDKATKAAEDFDIANAQAEASARETGEALSGMAKKAKSASDALAPVSKGAAALVGAAVATVPATDDLRQRLSMLETNATSAGYGMDTITEALKMFYAVSGDMDASVEALSNLISARVPENNMLEVVKQLSGAVIAFPDTLKIESLADSLQETLATGEATGQFGELLERLGVDLETVNENMTWTTSGAGQLTIAMQDLARNGLGDLHTEWETNNEDLIKSRESQYELQVATAEFAETILPLMTQLTDILSDVMGWFTQLPDGVQKGLMAFVVGAALIAPFTSGLGKVLDLAGKFTTKFPEMSSAVTEFASGGGATLTGLLGTIKGGFTALWAVIQAHPLGTVVTAIGLAIAALTALYNTSEEFRNFVDGVFSSVIEGIQSVIQWLDSAISKVKEFFGLDGGGGRGVVGGKVGWDTLPVSVPGYANGGVFAPNNPMIIGVGDNKTEREIIAPESALMETFARAAQNMGGSTRQQVVKILFTGSLAQLGRVLQPVIVQETDRQGPQI